MAQTKNRMRPIAAAVPIKGTPMRPNSSPTAPAVLRVPIGAPDTPTPNSNCSPTSCAAPPTPDETPPTSWPATEATDTSRPTAGATPSQPGGRQRVLHNTTEHHG